MIHIQTRLMVLFLAVAFFCTAGPVALAQSSDAQNTTAWRLPNADAVRAEVFAWLDKQKVDKATRQKATELWSSVSDELTGKALLERVVDTMALADKNVAQLVGRCSKPRQPGVLSAPAWLVEEKTPPLVANNLRLFYGRWLAHQLLYDEALEQLAGLEPKDVVDPASLLFYQGLVHHRLLGREAGLEAIDRLLDGAERSPQRYVVVAKLMKEDINGLKEDTLDHIARRMEDIERRLDLGRAGKKVRKVEDGVIESLDKLIKKLEEQAAAAAAAAAAGGNNIRSSRPAPDSRIIGGKGRGDVTRRNIGSDSGWGDLPPKQREEALQQIGRDFPSHYRDVIEQYFRRLASEKGKE